MKVQDILTDESKWTQGRDARDANGNEILPLADEAVCWCLGGALVKAGIFQLIGNLLFKPLNGQSIWLWNDAPERTFAEVRALIEELDI